MRTFFRLSFFAFLLTVWLPSLSRSDPPFFFTYTATTEIYTLSLHDALPIFPPHGALELPPGAVEAANEISAEGQAQTDRKSTRLNSSHSSISYAVFCLK